MFRDPLGLQRKQPEGYDTAQICLNGHVITRSAEDSPEFREKHCSDCGAETVTACPHCLEKIRGYLRGSMPSLRPQPAPAFCHNCGKPYPWTDRAVQAIRELALETDGLTNEEKENLSRSLDDLVRDTPQTQVAIARFKKFAAKAGSATVEAMKTILVSVATEAVKKHLGVS